MRFSIHGVDETTGFDRQITVDAESEDDALAVAKLKGVFATYATTWDGKGSPPSPPWGRDFFNRKNITTGVLLGVVAFSITLPVCLFLSLKPSPERTPAAWVTPEPSFDRPSHSQEPSHTSPALRFREGQQVWLSRNIVGAKDRDSLKKLLLTLRDNDEQAFIRLVLRGDAVQVSKGTKVTIVTVPREDSTLLTVRPEGSPDELWTLSKLLEPGETQSIRDREIDSYVDQQVEKHWQPGRGNSKEDAKKLTKDVMKAKNWKELEEALERNIREGR